MIVEVPSWGRVIWRRDGSHWVEPTLVLSEEGAAVFRRRIHNALRRGGRASGPEVEAERIAAAFAGVRVYADRPVAPISLGRPEGYTGGRRLDVDGLAGRRRRRAAVAP